jgi:hypothetical protein
MKLTCRSCQRTLENAPEREQDDWIIRCFHCGAKNIVIAALEVVGWRI